MIRHDQSRIVLFATLLIITALASALHADIYEWEWVNPANHSQGKQPSTTVCPDGAGLMPVPGMNAYNKDLTNGYLIGFDLTGTHFEYATLVNADLTGSNLSNAYFYDATFTDTDLTGTTIFWTDFEATTNNGFTQAKFESTASYVSGELIGIGMRDNNLSGWNFAGKNLTDAYFYKATLTGADFSGATIAGANFYLTTNKGFTQAKFESTASYISGDLTGVRLGSGNNLDSWNFAGKNLTDAGLGNGNISNANFAGANLTNANLSYANISGADLTGATIVGANFEDMTGNSLTQVQFESTASFTAGDLSGVVLGYNILTNWNFAGKNLTDAGFGAATLTNVDFTGATIAGANFGSTTNKNFTQAQFESTASYISGELAGISLGGNNLTNWNFAGKNLTDTRFYSADLEYANLSGADARGAYSMSYTAAGSTTNFVQPDGRVEGLNVAAGGSFRVWDYDGALGITVGVGFSVDDTGTLVVGLEDGDWGSTISFDSGISVSLDGTLQVELRNGFMPSSDDEWQLFDFAGVTVTGTFDTYVLPDVEGSSWDTSGLLSTGILSIIASIPGDANDDGTVDKDDAALVALHWMTGSGASWGDGDFNRDGRVDDIDATILAINWQRTANPQAAVPEPGSVALLLIGSLAGLLLRRTKTRI